MDQINVLKGYGKVADLEHQNPPPSKQNSQNKSLLATILLSTLILIGLIIGACIHKSDNGTSARYPALTADRAESIKIVCNMTHYPDSCFNSIVSLNSSLMTDPEVILKLSLQISLTELSNFSSSLKNLTADAEDGAALKDCKSLIDEAIDRVNSSKVEMEVGPGEKMLTESKINDIQTWMSSAMTDQDSCVDGLEEMKSESLEEEVKKRMSYSKECVSNSLAIIANIHVILAKFNMPLH